MRLMGIGSNRLVRTREVFRGQDMRKFGTSDAVLCCGFIVTLWHGIGASDSSTSSTSLGAVGRRSAEATASVTSFLERLYYSTGETLPTEWASQSRLNFS